MTQQLLKPVSTGKTKDERLFSGIWLRWEALNLAERVVCVNIVLLPLWWLVGIIGYIEVLLLSGIVIYEWRRYGGIRLGRPSLLVVVLFAYYLYAYIDGCLLFLDAYPSIDLPPTFDKSPISLIKSAFSFAVPTLVWYIQSNRIKVRLEALAWACSISLIQMLVLWLVFQFAFPEFFVHPPRTLYAVLTGKSQVYEPGVAGIGAGNYLLFKEEGRVRFFFDHYQSCSAFLGLVVLMALDLKNRLWSLSMIASSIFLLGLTANRSAWVALPVAIFIYFLLTLVRVRCAWLLLTLCAAISFTCLSLPPVTDSLYNAVFQTSQAVANARPGSTESRAKVYTETIERIPDRPIFGHKIEGPEAIDGPTQYILVGQKIGSHSFILGSLLYIRGVFGAGLFATFWGLLITWFYNTRFERPSCWLPILVFFNLLAAITVIQLSMTLGTLLCMALYRPTAKSNRRTISCANS